MTTAKILIASSTMDIAQEIAKVKVEDDKKAAAEAEKAMTPEELKAKKRAEIIANLAKARAEQEQKALEEKMKAEEPTVTPMTHYGSHYAIACDGCGKQPIEGYRYKCYRCANHDLCEACFQGYEETGKLRHVNKQNPIGGNQTEHSFRAYVEPGGAGFRCHVSKEVKKTVREKTKKVKPNDPCPCGSGKKYKKCCGAIKKKDAEPAAE